MNNYKISKIKEIGSSNAVLKEMAKNGASDRTVLLAEYQTAGHGQENRVFESPVGGLYTSILRKLPLPLCFQPGQLTVAVGEIVARILREEFGLNPEIKLPNDILIDKKKICGILVESFTTDSEIDIIIGIGLNLNTDLDQYSAELRNIVTSVKTLCHKECSIDAVLQRILVEVDLWFNSQKQY